MKLEIPQVHRVTDAPEICAVINAAAQVYQGVIPDECWHDPYMSAQELDLYNKMTDRYALFDSQRHHHA